MAMFYDGDGEYICARSWVPFYSDGLSFIAYFAWYECRINGENVAIQEFCESKCRMVIYELIRSNMEKSGRKCRMGSRIIQNKALGQRIHNSTSSCRKGGLVKPLGAFYVAVTKV